MEGGLEVPLYPEMNNLVLSKSLTHPPTTLKILCINTHANQRKGTKFIQFIQMPEEQKNEISFSYISILNWM